MKVVLVEEGDLGGVCLNWGCIPTKALLHSADMYVSMRNAEAFGLRASEVKVDFPAVVKRSREVAARLSKGVAFLMKKNGIQVVKGRGKLSVGSGDGLAVEVTGADAGPAQVEARRVVLATGARTRELPGMAVGGRVISSKQAMVLDHVPESIAVIGGGSIGVEFAHLFHSLGSKVTLFEVLPNLLPAGDEEMGKELEKVFRRRGMKVLTSVRIEGLEQQETSARVSYVHKDKPDVVEAEYVLLAVGVAPNSENLGLEKAGVETDRGWIRTDDFGRTTNPSIYAIGDVAGQPCLAHAASAEGILAAEHIAGKPVLPINYDNMPACTYCSPQVASVGLTEKAAVAAGYEVKIGRFPLSANGRALAMGEATGMVKAIVDGQYGELLGLHIIGPEASELLLEFAVARTMEATYEELLRTVHPHPTLGESIHEAVRAAVGQALHI